MRCVKAEGLEDVDVGTGESDMVGLDVLGPGDGEGPPPPPSRLIYMSRCFLHLRNTTEFSIMWYYVRG